MNQEMTGQELREHLREEQRRFEDMLEQVESRANQLLQQAPQPGYGHNPDSHQC